MEAYHVDVFVGGCVRAYENEYLHNSTSRITNGQTLVRYGPHQVYVLIDIHVTAGAFPNLVSC